MAPCDVVIDERNVFQPDVVVLRTPASWNRSNVGIPRLAIEILSPTSARRDRARKTPRLLDAGVDEVRLVDPAGESIEVVSRVGRRTASGERPAASRSIPGFVVVPLELFTRPT